MREGRGNCLKYLKRRWNRKKGRGNKDLKKGGKLGQRVGALKRGGLEPPYKPWTACSKSQDFIGRNQSMGNHAKHFACVLSYERNYLGLLLLPQGVIHLEMVECLRNLNN